MSTTGPVVFGLSEGLGPLPLWFDDGGRAWWGSDELCGAHILSRIDAAVAEERKRWIPVVAAHAADLRACVPTLLDNGMDATATEFLLAANELTTLTGGPNVRTNRETTR